MEKLQALGVVLELAGQNGLDRHQADDLGDPDEYERQQLALDIADRHVEDLANESRPSPAHTDGSTRTRTFTISDARKKRYISAHGDICPMCHRENVLTHTACTVDDRSYKDMECEHCKASWTAIHTLSDVQILDPGQEVMNQGEALNIILELAGQNALDSHQADEIGEPGEYERQQQALEAVQAYVEDQAKSASDTSSGDSHWEDHPDYPVEDWQYQVANGYTRRSYAEWVAAEMEARDG